MKITKACNIFYKLADGGKVIDLSNRFQAKKDQNEFLSETKNVEKNVEDIPEVTNIGELRTQDLVNKEKGIWMHRFSDVRKDKRGFFILKSDSALAKKFKIGDLLSDYAMNMTPYWEVLSIENERIDLKPIGTNPFATGIGAGGARLTEMDAKVFSGEYEKERLDRLNKLLETGNAAIDDVKYLLKGTCPVRMGPNGAEGGWYNADDTHSNRGGRSGMKGKDIVEADAKFIKQLGIPVPKAALEGRMTPRSWTDWINGNGEEIVYIPKDIEKYIERSKPLYNQDYWDRISSELRINLSPNYEEKLHEMYEPMLEDIINLSPKEFKLKHPEFDWFDDKDITLKRIIEHIQYKIDNIKQKREKFDETLTEDEDMSSEQSILKNVFNKERRVSIKNVKYLIQMAVEDDKYLEYLYDVVKLGGTDWLANEAIIQFFDRTNNIEGLKLCYIHLKDPTNIRYTAGYLAEKGEYKFIIEYADTDSLEALYGIFSSIYRKISPEEFRQLAEKTDLVNKVMKALREKDSQDKYHATQLARILQVTDYELAAPTRDPSIVY